MKNYMMNSKKMVFCLGLLVAGFSTSRVWAAEGQTSSDKPCEVGSTDKVAPAREPVPTTPPVTPVTAASAQGGSSVEAPAPAAKVAPISP